jgi:hypothetical protein
VQPATLMRYFPYPLGAIVLLAAGPVCAQEAYLCISDKASGMYFDKGTQSWAPAIFQSGKKYIFKKAEGSWALFPFGSTYAWAGCGKDFEPSELTQECSGIEEFAFNKKTLRFQVYYKYGFAYPSAHEGGDTPYIEIGTCSAL